MPLARSPQQIGTAIRRERLRRGLSQKQLAESLGMRQATISDIESGLSGARLSTLLQILAALDLEMTLEERNKSGSRRIEDLF